MSKIAVFPGTFDPITNGHIEIVKRGLGLFDTIIVAVAVSSRKSPYFNLSDRLAMCQEVFAPFKKVVVKQFDNLVVRFAREEGASFLLRGIRSVSDFDYEFQMASMNRQMQPELDTIFLPAAHENAFISGSMIREIVSLGESASEFVPEIVINYLKDANRR